MSTQLNLATNSVSLRKTMYGRAKATKALRNSGIASFNRFQEERGDPLLDDITEVYVEADNMQILLESFGEWYAESKILQNNTSGKFLEASSKAKYWGNVREALIAKFPSHEAWNDEEWSKDVVDRLQNIAKRSQFDKGTDSQDANTRPLYRVVRSEYVRFKERSNSNWSSKQGRDLHSIMSMIIKEATRTNQNFEKRAIIMMTYYGVGRGGEPKFLRYDDCVWDTNFEHFETMWRQLKVLKKTPLTFGSNPPDSDLETDLYHAFACFFAAENGLYRSERDAQIAKFMFPSLHAISDASVATQTTKWLRQYCDQSYRKSTTAKSLRMGSNNFLAINNRDITREQRVTRGCWAPSDTADKPAYRDVAPALTYPPFCSLAGWFDPNANNLPMRIPPTLPEDDLQKIRKFHNHLYIISGPKFVGLDYSIFLTPFLWTCTASAILYFPQSLAKYNTTNPMNEKLIRVMLEQNIARDTNHAMELLTKWSQAIGDDFRSRNNVGIEYANRQNLVPVVGKHTEMLQQQQSIQQQQSMLLSQVLSQHSALMAQNAVIIKQNEKLMKLLGSKRRLAEIDDVSDEDSVNNLPTAASHVTSPESGLMASVAAKAVTPSNKMKAMLVYGSKAALVAKKGGSGVELKHVLQDMYGDGRLQRHRGQLHKLHLSIFSDKDQSKYRAAMELLQASWTPDQEKQLSIGNSLNDEELEKLTDDVQYTVLVAMRAMMDGIPIGDVKSIGKLKGNVLGLGTRYLAEKKQREAAGGVATTTSKDANACAGTLLSYFVKSVMSPSK